MNGQKKQSGAEFTNPTHVNPFSDNSRHKKSTKKNQFSICKILRNKVKVLTKRFPLKANNTGYRTQMLKFGVTNDLSIT